MSKVIDAFSFFDELDLLEIRFNILNDYVDYFVIVEATETFSGKGKKLFFDENKERYKKWMHKIIHYVVDDYPFDRVTFNFALNSRNTGKKEHWWMREFYQKEKLIDALGCFSDDDIVYVSDLDEVWNPETNFDILNGEIYRPLQTAYHYYLNYKSNQDVSRWTGTRVGTLKTLRKYGANHFRTESYAKSIPIPNGGWHFTYLSATGDESDKVKRYAHPVYKLGVNKGFNLFIDESELPNYILNNKEKWDKYFIKKNQNDCSYLSKLKMSILKYFK